MRVTGVAPRRRAQAAGAVPAARAPRVVRRRRYCPEAGAAGAALAGAFCTAFCG
ncbi:hypothetical protein IST495A_04913 [Burkholderia multivorans]|nr:hypothetical protein IST495A_04913 [Burkholderia multivorans]